MGYKLNGSKLKYCAEYITTFKKKDNGRRLYVKCADKDSGAKICMFLSGIYNPKKVEYGVNYKEHV